MATYNELRAALSSYVHRTDADTIANEPNALEFARLRLTRLFQAREALVGPTSLALTSSAATLPADFAIAECVADSKGELAYISPREFTTRLAQNDTERHYTITGSTLRAPSALGASVLLTYYTVPPVIAGTGTNWASISYPDIWMWLAIAEQQKFLQDIEEAQMAEQNALQLIREAQLFTRMSESAGGKLTMRTR